MALRHDFDGVVWTGTVRGTMWPMSPWWLALPVLVGITVMATHLAAPLFVLLAVIILLRAVPVLPVDVELRITDRGLAMSLVDPLPWEVFAARRAWIGRWTSNTLHMPWEAFDSVYTQDRQGALSLNGLYPRYFKLLGVADSEVRQLFEVIQDLHTMALTEEHEAPPEAFVNRAHPRAKFPWRKSFGKLANLPLELIEEPLQSPDRHPEETMQALRKRLDR